MKNKTTLATGYTLLQRIYEFSNINLMLKSLIPGDVKINIAIDDVRLKSNLTTNRTIRFY